MSDQHEAEFVTGAGCGILLAVASQLHQRFDLPVDFMWMRSGIFRSDRAEILGAAGVPVIGATAKVCRSRALFGKGDSNSKQGETAE